MIRASGEQRRRPSGDSGVGLVELLVSMVVFSVLAIVVTSVFVNTIQTSRYVRTKTATTADTRIAMEAMTRSLRVAITPKGEPSALVEADANRVVFYSSLARGANQTADLPTKVTYDYDAATGCLRETQVEARLRTGAGSTARPFEWASGTSRTKCLIETFAPPTFEYFNDGLILKSDGSPVPPVTVPSGGFSSATQPAVMATIASIQVSVDVQDPDATDVNGVQARDRVTLTNVLSALKSGD